MADETEELTKYDLACGNNKRPGFKGIDKYATESTDLTFDLLQFPWPIADESCDELNCSHFFEHIPQFDRPKFMEECYRVLKAGKTLTIICPHWSSIRSIQDFTHMWPPVAEASFLYFNKHWREQNKLTHGLYDVNCDFDFTYGYSIDGEVQLRNQEFVQFALKHYNNAVMDVHVTLTKRAL